MISIIQTHGYKSDFYGYLASVGKKVSLISTDHNWLGDDTKMKFYAFLDRYFLRNFEGIVAVSDEIRMTLIASGVSPHRVTVVRNGIFCLCIPNISMKGAVKQGELYSLWSARHQ